jgi:hypothetical protein
MRLIKPRDGEIRVIEKFLFFPKSIDGEVRWFEKVKIKQKCFIHENLLNDLFSEVHWVDISWDN